MRIAIILVHYRTPDLLREALSAITETTADLGVEIERIVVDNGSDTDQIDGVDASVIRPGENLGYAGGINLGVSHTRADCLLLMNPDVLVRKNCVARLVQAIQAGAAAAGPRFWWDRDHTLLLPPTERRAVLDETWRALAGTGPRAARIARRRWRAHARTHWSAEQPIASHELSGALLAISREAWDRIGPFDAKFQLYFEETDWLERLRAAGLRAVHEPRAQATHLYARSTVAEQQSSEWFAASRDRYRRRHVGWMARQLLDRVEAWSPSATAAVPEHAVTNGEPWQIAIPPEHGGAGTWVEISNARIGFPAAVARVAAGTTEWTLPDAVRRQLEAGTYWLRLVTEEGREVRVRCYSAPGAGYPPSTASSPAAPWATDPGRQTHPSTRR